MINLEVDHRELLYASKRAQRMMRQLSKGLASAPIGKTAGNGRLTTHTHGGNLMAKATQKKAAKAAKPRAAKKKSAPRSTKKAAKKSATPRARKGS